MQALERGYTPLGELESDRSGVLIAARSEVSGALVDVRVLAPALVADRAFMRHLGRDMRILREVRQTNLVSVLEYDNRVGAVIYESVLGSTLRQVLMGHGPLELSASLVLLDDCAAGLEELHNVGVLHRNVSPAAVVIETTGAVLLRDAGLMAPDSTAGLPPEQRPYLAPEVLHGAQHTAAADLYAVTAVFVESIGDRAPKTGVRSDLRALITHGMATDPCERSGSMGDFRRELDGYGRTNFGETWRKKGRALLTAAASAQPKRSIRVGSPAESAQDGTDGATAAVALLRSDTRGRARVWAGLGAIGFAVLVGLAFAARASSLVPEGGSQAVLPANLDQGTGGFHGSTPSPPPTRSSGGSVTAPPALTNPLLLAPSTPGSHPTFNPLPTPTPNPTLASQTITFTSTPPSGATYGGSYTASATGGASGNPIVFSAGPSSTGCTQSSTGPSTFDFTGVGICTIDTYQAGNSDYNPAQNTQVFTIGRASQTISFTTTSPANATYGGSYSVGATGGASGNPIVFSAGPSSTGCTQSSSGPSTFDFTGVGICTVDTYQAGNSDYNPAQNTQMFTIGRASQTISFTTTGPSNATYGGSYSVGATAPAGAVTFSADSTSVSCNVSPTGSVAFTSSGACVIDANQGGNADYSAAPTVKQRFNVAKASQTIKFTSVVPCNPCGATTQYAVTARASSGLSVTFGVDSSSTPGSCTISGSTVTINGGAGFPGTCVIDAYQNGDLDYSAAPVAKQSITVS